MGGLARRAAFIKVDRARRENAHLLLLDSGNTFWGPSPSPATIQSQGKVIVAAMNLMGYDVMALGETDLQLGEDVLRQRIAEAHFPVLSANVIVESSGELLTDPYVLLEIGGRPVGIIGLTGTGTSQVIGTLATVDPEVSLATYVKELQAQTNIIIVLSNLGWESNVRLAETVPGIDFIISTGSSEVLTERWQSPQTGTLICQLPLGRREHPEWVVTTVKIDIDSAGLVTEHVGHSFEFGPEFADDPEIRQLLDSYRTQ